MKKISVCILLFVVATISFAQKGTFIGVNYNGWLSRNSVEVDFIKRKATGYAFEMALGFGEYGNRKYDEKTKDLAGRTYLDPDFSETFFNTKNKGVQLKVEESYQFALNSLINIDLGFFASFGTYQQKSEYDAYLFDSNGNYGLEIIHEKYQRFNFAIGFEVESIWKISKKEQLVFGCKLPFYILNPNKYGISKFFDPPLLGLEPVLNIGFRHRFNN